MAKARKSRPKRVVSRFEVMNELRASATDKWAQSTNPVKKRIGRLEVAWREGIQWLAEDIQSMYLNFTTMADAYDTLDINIAATKALLIEKGIITEEEFEEKRVYLVGVLNKERARRQAELERLQREAEEEAERVAKAEESAADGSQVTSELQRIHKAAVEAGKRPELPPEATVFGG